MLDTTSVLILLCTMWSAVFFYMRVCSESDEWTWACHGLSGIVLLFNSGMVLYLSFMALWTLAKRMFMGAGNSIKKVRLKSMQRMEAKRLAKSRSSSRSSGSEDLFGVTVTNPVMAFGNPMNDKDE